MFNYVANIIVNNAINVQWQATYVKMYTFYSTTNIQSIIKTSMTDKTGKTTNIKHNILSTESDF